MGQSFASEDIAHADVQTLQKLATPFCRKNNPSCHAIGHLASIVTDSDTAALSVCDAAGAGSYRESCYQGVFMESAGSFVNRLFPATDITGKRRQILESRTYPSCMNFAERYRHACYLLLSDYREYLYKLEGNVTAETKLENAMKECSPLSGNDREYCMYGLGAASRLLGFGDLSKIERTQSLCDSFSLLSDRNACTLGLSTRFLYFDLRGVGAYCEAISEKSRQTLCYYSAFQWAENMFKVPEDAPRMCGDHENCLGKYKSYLKVKSTLPDYRYEI